LDTLKALDLSFSSASQAWCQARKAEGWDILIQCAWTGVTTPAPASANLQNGRLGGQITSEYTVVNTLPAATAVNKAVGAAAAEWEHLNFASVDVEVATTPAIIRQAVDGLRALGKKVCIYTGKSWWNWFQLQFGGNFDFSDVPAWLADYDGNPALDPPPLGRLGPVIGKQYRGSHDIGGVTVDASTFNSAFVSPPQEEDDMSFPPPHYHSNTEGAVMLIGLLKHPLDSAGHARAHALGSADIGPVDLSGLQYLASTFQQSVPADPGAGLTAEEIAAIAKAVRTEFETDPLK